VVVAEEGLKKTGQRGEEMKMIQGEEAEAAKMRVLSEEGEEGEEGGKMKILAEEVVVVETWKMI
jgi:hypothetical protein